MIIRVTFREKLEEIKKGKPAVFTMMFGDSYKSWKSQFCEFSYRFYTPRTEGWKKEYVNGNILNGAQSKSKWIGYGGLKWCLEEEFQKELNAEYEGQKKDIEWNGPRQYSKMVFTAMNLSTLYKALDNY